MKNKKVLISCSIAVAALLSAGVATVSPAKSKIVADAAANPPETKTFAMMEGGSIRTAYPTGLRFCTYVNQEWWDGLKDDPNVKIGTLIIPKEVLGEGVLDETNTNALNLEHTNYMVDGDYYKFNAALTGVPEVYWGVEICALSYVYADLPDDEQVNYAYTWAGSMVTRSIGEVACKAYKDGNTHTDIEGIISYVVDSVALTEESVALRIGQETTLETTLNFNDSLVEVDSTKYTESIIWKSSNEEVATVDENGNVTAVAFGDATITAQLGERTDSVEVTVGIKGSGTETDPYLLGNQAELAWFGSDWSEVGGNVYQLDADIDMTGATWTSIGESDSTFAGTLIGNNKTISGLTAPLFGYVSGASVKDLTLQVEISGSAVNYGALIREGGTDTTVENCTVEGSIKSTANFLGGIVGYAQSGLSITNCKNYASVTSSAQYVGGIVGMPNLANSSFTISGCENYGAVTSTKASSYVGGIVGTARISSSKIDDCHNYATVSGVSIVGGIVGEARVNVTKCSVSGTVEKPITIKSTLTSNDVKLGGIAGAVIDSATISECTVGTADTIEQNATSISGYNYVGGIAGHLKIAKISSCTNYATVEASSAGTTAAGGIVGGTNGTASDQITACNNYGAVTGTATSGTGYFVGGIVGLLRVNASVSSCNNYANVKGYSTRVGGIVGCNRGSVTSCYVLTTATINNTSVSAMTVYYGDSSSGVGAIIGFNDSGSYSACGTIDESGSTTTIA